jgi:hypothetical protein
MTLSTLKTMNVQMGDLRESLMLKPPRRDRAGALGRQGDAAPGRQGRGDSGGRRRSDAVVGRASPTSSPSSPPRR